MIVHKSFKHGWFYHYRIHLDKAEKLCAAGLFPLKQYLCEVKDNCPDDYFLSGPRGSQIKKSIEIDMHHLKGHEVCSLAAEGLSSGNYKTAHSNVQMFMLQNDTKTISVEVPIWMLHTEMDNYAHILGSTEALTGHIDALRVEEGKIWVWDYKPGAVKERFAATQVNLYSLMLSMRTGIPLNNFRCGYFDDKDAFIFKPESKIIWK